MSKLFLRLAILSAFLLFMASASAEEAGHERGDTDANTAGELPGFVPIWEIPSLAELGELSPLAKALNAVLQAYAAGMAARDIEAVSRQFVNADNFVAFESGYQNFGWDDYRASHLEAEFRQFDAPIRFEIRLLQVSGSGEMAYAAYAYRARAQMPGGEVGLDGLGTAVLSRVAGDWRILHLHTSMRR